MGVCLAKILSFSFYNSNELSSCPRVSSLGPRSLRCRIGLKDEEELPLDLSRAVRPWGEQFSPLPSAIWCLKLGMILIIRVLTDF